MFDDDNDDIDIVEIVADTDTIAVKKVNYLNNKDMLKEIHKSKNSFCEYIDPKYYDYDVIVDSIDDILLEDTIDKAKLAKAARLSNISYESAMATTEFTEKPKLSEFKVKPDSISIDDLVFRVMTYEHIPLAPGRKKNPKTVADSYIRLNFIPYKHYILENGEIKEVGKSHYKKGKFNLDGGMITHKLATMFILMVNRYGQKTNWRGYTYIDEMKGHALVQLVLMGLRFDESRSNNPFSYYTQVLNNTFTGVFNEEKKTQKLRDDLLINSGSNPSFSRQLAAEEEVRRLREDAQDIVKDE